MKKLILMMLLVVGGVMNVSADDLTIFLNSGVWTYTEAEKPSLYMFNSTNNSINEWADFEQIGSSNYYKATLKEGYDKMIFVRKAKTSSTWENKHNQTNDIDAPTTNAMYKITAWHYDDNKDNNSVYEKLFDFPTVKIKGIDGDWTNGISLTSTDCINYNCTLNPNSNTSFKLVMNDNTYFGYSNLNNDNNKLYIVAPDNWITDDGDENNHNLLLNHSNTLYKSYNVKATWTISDSWWTGWTLTISGNEFKTVPVSVVSDKGYATFSCDKAVTIPADGVIAAYRADHVNAAGEIIFKKVSGDIPANTGLLLKSSGAASQDFAVAASGFLSETNLMVATTTATEVAASGNGTYNYFLADGNNGVGFYNVEATATSAAGKAYLQTTTPLTTTTSARASWYFEDEATTGINSVKNEKQSNEVYNLNGQRVNNAVRGLYIVNGKKVIMK